MAVDSIINGVNAAVARALGDKGTYIVAATGVQIADVDIVVDDLTAGIGGDQHPVELRPTAQIPDTLIPVPVQGDCIEQLGKRYSVDGIARDNGMWLLDLRYEEAC